MQKLKTKVIGEYTKNGKVQYVFTVSGTPEAIKQYIADQANVVKADGTTGASIHESGAPLYWSKNILTTEISRTERDGSVGWFADSGDQRAITATAEKLRASNPALADFMLKAQAEEIIASIKSARAGLRPSVSTPVDNTKGLDNA